MFNSAVRMRGPPELEASVDRRLFLTGMLGLAGVTAVSAVLRPGEALAVELVVCSGAAVLIGLP